MFLAIHLDGVHLGEMDVHVISDKQSREALCEKVYEHLDRSGSLAWLDGIAQEECRVHAENGSFQKAIDHYFDNADEECVVYETIEE